MGLYSKIKYRLLRKEIKNRFSYEDFLYYRMQEVSFREINRFATCSELAEYERLLNSDVSREIFNDKGLFIKKFGKYMHRGILVAKEATPEEFLKFRQRYKKMLVKPSNMYAGIGIEMFDEKKHTLEWLKEKRYIVEEYIGQAPEYSKIYDKALNTIRITTLIGNDDEVKVLFAVNQFGSAGSIVDNDDATSIWAEIDSKTGVVIGADIDIRTGLVLEKHPDSCEKIVGFANPKWEEITELARIISREIPECRLVGWDIAVREDYSLELIEGNVTPELDLYQMISRRGLRMELKDACK